MQAETRSPHSGSGRADSESGAPSCSVVWGPGSESAGGESRLPPFADAVAPGIAIAQAVGRWGNWFNQELFGGPTTLPWGVEIDLDHRPAQYLDAQTFQPTFLYESLWMVIVAGILVWADRRWRLGHGQVFALYVVLYCLGRLPIELVRIDPANEILGLRVNVWVSVLIRGGRVGVLRPSTSKVPPAGGTRSAPGLFADSP